MFSFDIDYKKKRVILSLLGLIAGCVFTFAQVDQGTHLFHGRVGA